MAENRDTADKSEQAELAAVPPGVDLETLRKVKELCQRYGKQALKEVLDDSGKAA